MALPPTMVDIAALYAPRVAGIPGSEIDRSISVLAARTGDIIRFGIGSPGLEAMPPALSELASQVMGNPGTGVFDYGPTEGDFALRGAVLDFFRARHFDVADDELLITTGGMQGLDLAAKLFVAPGDLVVVESPTYTNGTAVMRSYEGELLEVPVDDDGMDVAWLADRVAQLGRRPKLIYAIPNFQNPAGVTLSLPRRRLLVECAARWGSVLVEDDPYGDLRFEGRPLPSLTELADGRALVIGIYTFSKILAPGLRVGWVTAPSKVISQMIDARQGMDTCTNVPLQRLVSEIVSSGILVSHLDRLRLLYRERREAMLGALADIFGGTGSSWTSPQGGFFVWLTLPEGVDMRKLAGQAVERGVAYIPGTAFSVAPDRFVNSARLCYATTSPSRIREGISRLHAVVTESYQHLTSREDLI
jgi:2-aminoadipate transaminase